MKYILTIMLLAFLQNLSARDIVVNTEKRIALIIGNGNYAHGLTLKNPVNDANTMADSLEKIGFKIIKETDADKSTFEKAIYEFSKKISQYNTIIFFYAGHGIQVDGINYLLPVDAVLEEKNDVKFQAIPVNFITDEFNKYPGNTSIILLDACRNNPFRSWMRGFIVEGFKSISNQPAGSIIAYATCENATALDGTGNNGLYTEHLVKEIMKPQSIDEVFINTRNAVLEKSKYSQCPQEWNMMTQRFYFIKPAKESSTTPDFKSNKIFNAVYSLYYNDETLDKCKVTEFEISAVTDSSFQIKGLGQPWSGKGVIHKDKTSGRYDWEFENGAKGSTYIGINSHGSIQGKVSGSNLELDWVYIAYPMK